MQRSTSTLTGRVQDHVVRGARFVSRVLASGRRRPSDTPSTPSESAPSGPPVATDNAVDFTEAVERAYRLILGRAADPAGAADYVEGLRSGRMSLSEVCASLAASDEFAQRLHRAEHPHTAAENPATPPTDGPNWVDVTELIKTVTVAELAERAEGYFRAVEDPDRLLAKPFKDAAEAPDLLVTFGQVLRGLRPLPGMTVLDFGAGTCWTSRFLAQLGCRVKALDVSATALEFGRRLFQQLPVMGDMPAPEFLVFDGHRIDLPDASVDRILSFDAFHHVPNPAEVIKEMARVLRPGGIAAFSEPGDRHSHQPQSQYEMRNFGVIENDVIIEDIWAWAQEAGFTELRLCLLDSSPAWVDLRTFQNVITGRAEDEVFPGPTRRAIADRRMFWLRRAGDEALDSRAAEGLMAELALDDVTISESGRVVTATCRVRNPGPRTWLPSDAEFGPVRLGVRLHLNDQTIRDLTRIYLPGAGVRPGESRTFPVYVEIPDQPEGIAAVEFDLVSEMVTWFGVNGSPVVKIPLR